MPVLLLSFLPINFILKSSYHFEKRYYLFIGDYFLFLFSAPLYGGIVQYCLVWDGHEEIVHVMVPVGLVSLIK
jgi:hypothetical protein